MRSRYIHPNKATPGGVLGILLNFKRYRVRKMSLSVSRPEAVLRRRLVAPSLGGFLFGGVEHFLGVLAFLLSWGLVDWLITASTGLLTTTCCGVGCCKLILFWWSELLTGMSSPVAAFSCWIELEMALALGMVGTGGWPLSAIARLCLWPKLRSRLWTTSCSRGGLGPVSIILAAPLVWSKIWPKSGWRLPGPHTCIGPLEWPHTRNFLLPDHKKIVAFLFLTTGNLSFVMRSK